jgi:hypothetical protein
MRNKLVAFVAGIRLRDAAKMVQRHAELKLVGTTKVARPGFLSKLKRVANRPLSAAIQQAIWRGEPIPKQCRLSP